ncbi:alpha-ketoacid dehydrogenase subunit beta [Candidatus Peregrinibacteria bacterium]|nr:alpha-ketoacid dehydrogenase subunit beta [Candidatus Peregrinibacteria bacterium]
MPNQTLTMVQAINLALKQEMAKDKTVLCYGEDVGVEGGVFRVTEGLQKLYGDQRCFDSPLAEAGIIGTAIGLSINGMKPVVEMQFSGFMFESFPQLMCHAARMRNRSRGRFSCPLVLRTPYGGGIHALEHHCESEEAILAHIPGLKVVIPSTPFDAKGLLIAAIRDPDPVIFMEPKRVYRAFKQEVPEEEYFIPIGKAGIVQSGSDVTVIAWGAQVRECMKTSDEAKKLGISMEIVDLRTISPIDYPTIFNSVSKTGRVVIVHEAYRSFGPGAELSATINEEFFGKLKAPIQRVTGFDIVYPLLRSEDLVQPEPVRILEAIRKVVGK